MCLDVVYRGKQKREAIAKLARTFYVWKWLTLDKVRHETTFGVEIHEGQMVAPYRGPAYSTPTDRKRRLAHPLDGMRAYRSGWHAYIHRLDSGMTRCIVHKKHIQAIGLQSGRPCVVLSHITFPRKCGQRPRKRVKR